MAWAAAGWACSEDRGTLDGPGDASTQGDPNGEAGADGEAEKLSLDANDLVTYVAQPTPLQASVQTNISGVSLEWSIAATPQGSALAIGPLGAAGENVIFTADVAGAYTLRVRASASGLEMSKNVSITAVEAPVFFAAYSGSSNGTAVLYSVGTHGTGQVALTCVLPSGSYFTRAALGLWAGRGADWLEARAGSPSFFVAVVAQQVDGGFVEQTLITTTSASRCGAGGLIELDHASSGTLLELSQPRVSPDSKRVAYYRRGPPKQVFTAALDGQGTPRALGGLPNNLDVRPKWLDPTHVAWIKTPVAGNWQIVIAPDQDTPPNDVYMSCPGLPPAEFDFVADGSVIVSIPSGDGGVDRDLVIYARDADHTCVEQRRWATNTEADGTNYGGDPLRAALAHDFALSPDRTEVAYLKDEGSAPLGTIYVADVKGAKLPQRVSSTHPHGLNGPRWVAGGGLLAWSVQVAVVDAGDPEAGAGRVRHGIAIVPASGGTDHLVVDELDGSVSDGGVVVGIGNGSSNVGYYGCASGGGSAAGGAGAWALAGILALLGIRRRRSRPT